jgi:hypothetical protein
MAKIGDQVQVLSARVGQLPREGTVTGVNGTMLRVMWSTGEESTLVPGAGSTLVIPKHRGSTAATKKVAKTPAKATAKTSRR